MSGKRAKPGKADPKGAVDTAAKNGVRRPIHPLLILAAAALMPGAGHVLLGQASRGLVFQIFMIIMGIITWHLAAPDRSLVGRLAGGIFIYAISVMDAYRLARLRWAAYQRLTGTPE